MAVLTEVERADDAPPMRRSQTNLLRGNQDVSPGFEITTADGTSYTVMNLLGHGTFAKVYKCRCESTLELYAVKVVSLSRMKFSPDFEAQEQMITREVEILKKLRHERICNMHDFLRTEENWFLVMELVCHGELFHNIPPMKGMRELEAKYVFQQLLEGIGYIHSKGVIHRDLKPENILIVRSQNIPGPDGAPAQGKFHDIKIADFGLSKVREGDGNMANSCVGSPVYAAPEIFSEHGYGQSVDTWSLGAILFVMLCGQYPFDGRRMPRDVTLSNVAQVSGFVGASGVDAITLLCRDGEARSYSSSDAPELGPWRLQREEKIYAVTQERCERSQGKLGRSLALFTTMGQVLTLDGPSAAKRARFTAPCGAQISGLEFEGSVLTAVRTAKGGKASRGVIAQIRGWSGDAVDGIELVSRDGGVDHQGGDGGSQKGPWKLDEYEKIVAVVQEHADKYAGNSLVLFTSAGNIIALEGAQAKPCVRFAVPYDKQIDRLKFNSDGRLIGALTSAEADEIRCADFRMDMQRWTDLSQDAQDMVCGLLRVDVEKRWSLAECLHKSWLRDPMLPHGEDEDEDFTDFIKRGSKNDLIHQAAVEAAREPDYAESRVDSSVSLRMPDLQAEGDSPSSSTPVSPAGSPAGGSVSPPAPRGDRVSSPSGPSAIKAAEPDGASENFFPPPRRKHIEEEKIFGSVQVIRGRLGSAVDRVELHMWKGHSYCYGGNGGHGVQPYKLKPQEFITAVEQERWDGDLGYLGKELAFFTSSGRVHTITGHLARRVHRFAAKLGYEICGLTFNGPQLIGVQTQRVVDGRGTVASVSARLADCLDQVKMTFKNGQNSLVYGGEGGKQQAVVQLQPDEYIVAVSQEHFDQYLGCGIAFFTSGGAVIAFDGHKAGDRSRFAAAVGQQIFGLHFEGSKLVDVLARNHSARFRGASKEHLF